eukprot:CAMPEP_0198290240 /NCGR_PEP_ID=MMETSP1449-20131203/8187_1 /TAXON_ID=420275 /ORGANISM="Attheya septentrionalis, Strain CCMP2084" /LENGTH=548 /DNA_ID=CAMNT_0043988723 /DNA_START=9 /DNA_END=1655 /DNA_ORIENTATION=-
MELEMGANPPARSNEPLESISLEPAPTAGAEVELQGNDRQKCNPFEGNVEARAWALDAIPRGVLIVGPAVFLSTALLKLAKEAAGCVFELEDDTVEMPPCDGRVYGMRPSSILTIYTFVVGIVSVVLLPLAGAILDHTPHRKRVGQISAVFITAAVFGQIFISSKTWFAVAILQVVVVSSFFVHLLCVFAYLPELTDHQPTLVKWTAHFSIVQYVSTLVFLVSMGMIIVISDLQEDEVAAARISQAGAFVVCVVCFGVSWTRMFGAREAASDVPAGQNLLTAGFWKVYTTGCFIAKKNRNLMWFLLSLSFSEAAVFSLSVIAITYMTDQLEFTSTENGIAILILLLASIPGCLISTIVTKRINPVRSLQICLMLVAINTACAALVLVGPGQQLATYAFAAGWGLATGWKYPAERVIYCSIIPPGQDAQLMGTYLFAGQILTWLPPLIFTSLNEAGVSMRISVASLDVFFVCAFSILFLIDDYQSVVDLAKQTGRIPVGTPHRVEQNGDSTFNGECTVDEHIPPLPLLNKSKESKSVSDKGNGDPELSC